MPLGTELDLPTARDHLSRHLALFGRTERHVGKFAVRNPKFSDLGDRDVQTFCEVLFGQIDGTYFVKLIYVVYLSILLFLRFEVNESSGLEITNLRSQGCGNMRRNVKFRVISTNAGTINVAHAKPSTSPVIKRDRWVFSQMPKIVSDQSTEIGISERKSQNRGSGSISSIGPPKRIDDKPKKQAKIDAKASRAYRELLALDMKRAGRRSDGK